jgi:hypothetical protein
VIAHKFLRRDGASVFAQFRWPLPHSGPGPWVEAQVLPCRSGVHACRPPDLPFWVNDVLYEIELDGDIVDEATKVVAPRGRLLRRIGEWDEDLRASYTRMCADRALQLTQSASPPLDDWAAVVEPSVPEGPALLGFVAARIGEEISGVSGYDAERVRQANWLAHRLSLSGQEDAP